MDDEIHEIIGVFMRELQETCVDFEERVFNILTRIPATVCRMKVIMNSATLMKDHTRSNVMRERIAVYERIFEMFSELKEPFELDENGAKKMDSLTEADFIEMLKKAKGYDS